VQGVLGVLMLLLAGSADAGEAMSYSNFLAMTPEK
jgi:hypothetical protein